MNGEAPRAARLPTTDDGLAAMALADTLLDLLEQLVAGVPRQAAYTDTWDRLTKITGNRQLPAAYRHGSECVRGMCGSLLPGAGRGAKHADSDNPEMALYGQVCGRLLWLLPTVERVVLHGMPLGAAARRSLDEAAGWRRGRRGRSRGALSEQAALDEVGAARRDIAEVVRLLGGDLLL